MAALGTTLVTIDEAAEGNQLPFHGFGALEDYVRTGQHERKSMPPLSGYKFRVPSSKLNLQPTPHHPPPTICNLQPLPVYLGVDVGSISTNVVLIDEQAQVVARRYLPTSGRPLEAVRRALQEIGAEVGQRVEVCGVGTTGSGRYLTGDFVGADVVRNEITAQARAALAIDPAVDTVFEIGGQDSKYIRLNHGAVVDFTMNSACAAGTGSFLEEQADRLKIDIRQDFSRLALSSASPTCLGERCTVFMESDIIHHQQQGARLDELTAGLAYAIAQNYLNRVVNGRPVGQNVFFQGGVAWNQSVVAAFQQLTGRKITVPPHHDVTGAIGAAILAMEAMAERARQGLAQPTKFKGFDLSQRHYKSSVFECRACPNLCEVNKVVISGEPPVFYGARCDRFEEAGRQRSNQAEQRRAANGSAQAELPDLFAERERLLLGDYIPPTGPRNGRLRLAIPRALIFYDLFPYWRTFFKTLDIELVLSTPTNPKITTQAAEHAAVETCFPAKLVYGHVVDLFDTDADFIFLPSIINRESGILPQVEHSSCPFVPAMAHLVTAHLNFEARGHRPLKFPLHMRWSRLKKRELEDLARQLGLSTRRIAAADAAAETAQGDFYTAIRQRGCDVLDNLTGAYPAAVLVGRPYNTCDLGACQDLPFKLRKLGVLPIPMDYLPLAEANLPERYQGMFWRSGQLILAAATLIRTNPRLQAIYVTNFNCGPDSFIINFFRNILGDKPFLELEMDNHTADAGIITRCEAFFDSLKMGQGGGS
jgi:predicted CoA-substrate-specific enzyme activase